MLYPLRTKIYSAIKLSVTWFRSNFKISPQRSLFEIKYLRVCVFVKANVTGKKMNMNNREMEKNNGLPSFFLFHFFHRSTLMCKLGLLEIMNPITSISNLDKDIIVRLKSDLNQTLFIRIWVQFKSRFQQLKID